MIAQLIVAAIGIWLMAAPAVLGYGDPAATNDRIFGPTIAALAIIATAQVTRSVRYANVVLGAWMVVSPLLLAYENAAMASSVVAGAAVVGLSFVRGRVRHRYGGGWASLFRDEQARRA